MLLLKTVVWPRVRVGSRESKLLQETRQEILGLRIMEITELEAHGEEPKVFPVD